MASEPLKPSRVAAEDRVATPLLVGTGKERKRNLMQKRCEGFQGVRRRHPSSMAQEKYGERVANRASATVARVAACVSARTG